MNPFAALGLSPALVRAAAERGYAPPTPIQAAAIAAIADILAGARTLRALARPLADALKLAIVCGGMSINPQMMTLRGGNEGAAATPRRAPSGWRAAPGNAWSGR